MLLGLQRSNFKVNHLPQSSTKAMNVKYSTSIPPFSLVLFTGPFFAFNYLEKKKIFNVFKSLILYLLRATVYICEILTLKFNTTLFISESSDIFWP